MWGNKKNWVNNFEADHYAKAVQDAKPKVAVSNVAVDNGGVVNESESEYESYDSVSYVQRHNHQLHKRIGRLLDEQRNHMPYVDRITAGMLVNMIMRHT